MYKLIAIDLDGTLLNSYGEISIENKEAMKKAIQAGSEIVLCSGRASSSIENFANEIGSNKYLIAGNGSLIYDMKNKQSIYDRYMDKEIVLEIIRICEENSIYYSVFAENTIITRTLNYNVLVYNSENASKPVDKRTNINITENVYDYIKKMDIKKFSKISVCDNTKVIFDGIIRRFRKLKGIEVLDVAHISNKKIKSGTQEVFIQYYYTEITNENVNKWNAVDFLRKKLNLEIDEVMCIGDNVNDKEMLQNAGLGVAMGNSAPYIREIADEIVSDNNSNGVKEAIDKFVLI